MVLELSISNSYILLWGLWQALREIFQNAMDGADDGHPMEISHEKGYLVVTNHNVVLSRSCWLLGKSGKRDTDARGKHGEGLKLAALVLCRLGIEIFIENGDELWTPVLDDSAIFGGETVLKVKVRKLPGVHPNDFRVYVKLPKREWKQWEDRLLTLLPREELGEVLTSAHYGQVLKDPRFKGRIYCKDIFVQQQDDLSASYNFRQLDLDRDRQAIDSWNLFSEISKIWSSLSSLSELTEETQEEIVTHVYASAAQLDSEEMRSLQYSADDGLITKLQNCFTEKHGGAARPVLCSEEATKLDHYGLKGVVVGRSLYSVLTKKQAFGDLDTQIKVAMQLSGHEVELADINKHGRQNWQRAINLLALAAPGLEDLAAHACVYHWDAPGAPLGTFQGDHSHYRIRVNKKVVQWEGFAQVLSTLIHEAAHRNGGDGERQHREEMERIWEQVTKVLIDTAGTEWLA